MAVESEVGGSLIWTDRSNVEKTANNWRKSQMGLLEWTCIRAINPHLDWPREQTVGTHIDVSHEAVNSTWSYGNDVS